MHTSHYTSDAGEDLTVIHNSDFSGKAFLVVPKSAVVELEEGSESVHIVIPGELLVRMAASMVRASKAREWEDKPLSEIIRF